MNIFLKKVLLLPVLLLVISCNAPVGNDNTFISIKTTLGDIKIKLYDETPFHRDNFIKLINTGFYNGVSFHRIIKDFMIQAGDPATKSGPVTNLPDSLNTYTIPAEFTMQYFHKKGALAAAREGNDANPEMRSSGTQFYIVQGVKYNDEDLSLAEQRINSNIKQSVFNKIIRETADSVRLSGKTISDGEIQEIASFKMFQFLTNNKEFKISEEQRNVYKSIGGVPRLDGTYTVFGEVIEGLDVVDRIASVSTDSNDKPVNDIKIVKIKIVSK
ncbi:MAG: peptidylprolyl isomerase [Bacteroidales bacterium]|nr:peptidylprolyl isomerase [Bacteroidales bacterium]MDP3002380.1 peptidylprolyl isomerase [Bacteroidales bacterium]